jgi:ABC-type Fe3+-siderophore transport system permease subunit
MRPAVLLTTLLLLTLASLLFSLATGSMAVSWQELLAVFSGADGGNGLAGQVVMELRWLRLDAMFLTSLVGCIVWVENLTPS